MTADGREAGGVKLALMSRLLLERGALALIDEFESDADREESQAGILERPHGVGRCAGAGEDVDGRKRVLSRQRCRFG